MMKKKTEKKMFVAKETLVDLTSHLRKVEIYGGCIGISTEGFDLRNHTICPQTSYRG